MTIERPGGAASETDRSLSDLHAVLHRYCLSLTKSAWDTDDLVQDTWLKVLERLKDQTHANPEALLLRIARNTWIDRVRREEKYRRILEEQLKPLLPKEAGGSAESALNLEGIFQLLFKHLSPLQSAVLLLRDAFEYSSEETAVLLGTTEGAVKAALHRARKVLRTLDPEEEELLLGAPADEEEALNLQALALAYQSGDVEAAVRIIQGGTSDVQAIGMHQVHAGFSSGWAMGYGHAFQPEARLAA